MRLYEFIDPIPCYYHGSSTPDLQILKARSSDLVKRDVVFAAILPEIAVAMSNHWTDDDFEFGHDTSTKREVVFQPYVMRELRPNAFEQFFSSHIYLYAVPAHYFTPNSKLQDFEVASFRNVPVHAIIKVDNALAYLKNSPIIRLKLFSDFAK